MKIKQTICITRILGMLFLATGLATGACTSEVTDEVTPPAGIDTGRREVLLTLKNKLALPGSTTRGIATTAENQLSTLDVYVFGSETETGTYTFQECFSYRGDDAGSIPNKSTNLPLAVDGGDNDSKTTGLLGLKKGLYVKLYCVANAPGLVDPATGNKLTVDDFTGLKLKETAAGVAPALQTPGIPTEADFLTYHTPVLTEAVATDILATPLAMSGAYTTPIDLTDPEGASRLSIGFKLTRMVSRFDVVNKAVDSRFTIKSISMGKGRRGATLFPIAVCDAQATVTPDKLITYPERLFDGAQANQGLQAGAFYTYASPLEDEGYLILKGDYQVNATEQAEVTYQVPFRQLGADGKETYLEIQHNHRYTIGITKADEYHLDFNLKVEDWADDGNIDDYVPENKPGEITLGNKDIDSEYETDPVNKRHTVKMSILGIGGNFEAKITATAMLQVTKTYAGGQAGQQYDWLKISDPVSTFAAGRSATVEYTYSFTVTPDYKGRFPRATVRFFDPISGNESILYVEAIAAPTPVESNQPSKAPNGTSDNPNSVDLDQLEVSLYRITNSQANVTISCADEVELKSSPTWLTVTKIAEKLPKTTYSIVLNNRDVVTANGKIVFHNVKKPALQTEYTVNLLAAPILPKFESVGTGNTFTPDATNTTLGDLAMNVVPGNKTMVVTTPMDGVTTQINFNGGSEWLKSDAAAATRATTAQQVVTFSLQESKLAGAKIATVTLVNKIGGKNEVFTISPKLNVGTIEKVSSIPTQNALNGTNMTLYKMPTGESEMKLKVTSYGGSMLTADNANVTVTKTSATRSNSVTQDEVVSYYTLTPNTVGTTTLTLANRSDPSKQTDYTVAVKSTAITNGSTTVAAAINLTNSISITSPEGCTVSVLDWGGSSKEWFTISTPALSAGSQMLQIRQGDNSATLMKPMTLQLTNNIVGGESKMITITPTFAAPKCDKTDVKLENIVKSLNNPALNGTNKTTYNVLPTAGGWELESADGLSFFDAVHTGNTVTVTSKKRGFANIIYRNSSDHTKTSSVRVEVLRSYAGQPVYEINGYYIAFEDARGSRFDFNHTICNEGGKADGLDNSAANPDKKKWFVPFREDWIAIIGGETATAAAQNFLIGSNPIFGNNWTLWSATPLGFNIIINAYTLVTGPPVKIGMNKTDHYLSTRCVLKK